MPPVVMLRGLYLTSSLISPWLSNDAAHSGPDLPTSVNDQDHLPQRCPLGNASAKTPFSGDSELSQVDKANQDTNMEN